jgi:hypothetical protein
MKPASVRKARTRPVSPVRILTAARDGTLIRGGDYRYRIGDRVVCDEVYDAEKRRLLVLGRDGTSTITAAGEEWIRRFADRRHPTKSPGSTSGDKV